MLRQILFALSLIASCAPPLFSADKPASATEQQINALLDQLVSPNEKPKPVGGEVDYPEGYDRAAQRKVFEAWKKLHSLGLKAFPQLAKRTGDSCYSMTLDTGFYEENLSVGRLCSEIIDGHIQPWGIFTSPGKKGNDDRFTDGDPRFRPRRPSYEAHWKDFDAWWASHKDKSLREIQIEALEWTIAEELKQPKDYSQDEIDGLKTMLGKLKASDQPLRPSVPFAR